MTISRRRFCLSLAIGSAAWVGWAASRRVGPQVGSSADGEDSPQALAESSSLNEHSRQAAALGTQVSIKVLHESRVVAERAVASAFRELDRIEDLMSLYRPESQLCQLNRDGVLANPHPHLLDVLRCAAELSERSGGKFDVTVQPLWQLHANCQKAGCQPSAEELVAVLQRVDWRRLEIGSDRVRFSQPNMAVTLNGIAQGFATDRVLATLRSHGIEHALIDAGELAGLGRKATGECWQVGIQHPREADAFVALADLDGRCLATSGDYATRFSDGFERHHLLDPDSGESRSEFASVSVLAPSGMLADGLSTAVFVLDVERGFELIQSLPNVDMLCVLKDGRVLSTNRFPRSDVASHVTAAPGSEVLS